MAVAEGFVGRREELTLLGRRLVAARAGTGGVVHIVGPAGIGKTRLVEEFLTTAGPTPVGWGAAVADEGMPALWPWTRALRAWSEVRAALASGIAGDAQRPYGSAEETAATTFAADTRVVDAIEEQARASGGLLIVLDDLHWADRATLRLLRRLAGEVRRLPLLVVATGRDSLGLNRAGAAEEVQLGPLRTDEACALLIASIDRADMSAVREAVRLAGGNPLYLRTLGRVATDQLRGHATWPSLVGTAAEFRALVNAALRAVGPDTGEVVTALSVLGHEADLALLASLVGADGPAAIVDRLQPAVPVGLVEALGGEDRDGEVVRFAHALVRDAAYASIPADRRADLHRRSAELLESLATGRDDRAGAVASHWSRAGEAGLALVWAVRAAEAARAAAAYDQAASYLELALEASRLAGIDGLASRAELLLDLGRVQYLGGHVGPSLATCQAAAEEGIAAGRPDVVARAALTVQGIGGIDVNLQVAELCERALTLLDLVHDADLRATVEAQLACASVELDAVEEAETLSRQALANATAGGDPNAELDAIRARIMLMWRPAEDDEVLGLGARAIELADSTNRPLVRLWAHTWRSDVMLRQADLVGVRREVFEIQRLVERTRLPLARWHLLRRQASLAALVGDFEGCRRLGRQAVDLAETWQDESVRYTHLAQTVCLAQLRGDPSDIDPSWMEQVPGIESKPLVAQAVVAAALHLAGRLDEARAMYEPLVPLLVAARAPLEAAALAYLPWLAVAHGDVASCRTIRDWVAVNYASSLAIGSGTVFYHGSVDRILGQLALASGDPAAAVGHLERGLSVDGSLGAAPFVAQGRLGLARAITDAESADAQARVLELARAAAADARRLDMPGLLGAAEAFLTEVRQHGHIADPLTEREREVVTLVAEGRTNRDVATALVLSERTVESHIRRILAKLNLTTRTELVRWFLQRPR